jgi:hypothetical protein
MLLTVTSPCNSASFPEGPELSEMLQGNSAFRMVLGRVSLDVRKYRVGQFRFKTDANGKPSDSKIIRSLNITLERGSPNLVLHRKQESQNWNIEAKGNGRTRLQFDDNANNYSVVWDQPAHGVISVVVREGDKSTSIKALSLWHIWFERPEICKDHLFPMLSKIEANWNLELIARETDTRLKEALAISPIVSEKKVRDLLQEFNSNDSTVRDRAHRELRYLGLAALTPMMVTNLEPLGPEQSRRIERLIQTMRPNTDDTPNRLASWLSCDSMVCRAIATRLDGQAKDSGILYVERLTGETPATIRR